jgi:predicted esterase
MSKNFYGFAIFFLIVSMACGLVHAYVSWPLNEQLLELPSIVPWYLTISIAGILPWMFIVVYFHYKRLSVSFYFSLVYLAAYGTSVFAFHYLLQTHTVTLFFAVITFLLILSQLVLSVSFLFSQTARLVWLKRAGIALLLASAATLAISVITIVSVEARLTELPKIVDRVVNCLSLLVPLCMAINFYLEFREAKSGSERQQYFELFFAAIGFVLISASVMNARSIIRDAHHRISNPDDVPEFIEYAARAFTASHYVSKRGDTLRYRFMEPKHYNSQHKYPIVICLHGSTGSGKDNAKQIATCLPAQILSTNEIRDRYPAFIFVPQAPRGTSFGGFTNLPGIDSLILEAMFELEARLPIDTTRRYVTGYSMGGYGTWSMICKWPDLFAAAVPMCGKGDVDLVPKIKDKHIWAFHGAQDINVPVSGSRNMIEAIRKAGGSPRHTEFPDRSHDITKDIREMPGWIDWMFEKRMIMHD